MVVGVLGVLAALAGMEHGIGEIAQGPVVPAGIVFESWPDSAAFELLSGEPALTLIPNLLVSGILTVIVSSVFLVWAVWGVNRRLGGLVLIALSVILLILGGGFGPPVLGVILGVAAALPPARVQRPSALTRALAHMWPWALAAAVCGYLGLVPGTLVLSMAWGETPDALAYGLMMLAFGGVLLSLVAARASDRMRAWNDEGAPGRALVDASPDQGGLPR